MIHFHKWYVAGVSQYAVTTDILWKCRKCDKFTVSEVFGYWTVDDLT